MRERDDEGRGDEKTDPDRQAQAAREQPPLFLHREKQQRGQRQRQEHAELEVPLACQRRLPQHEPEDRRRAACGASREREERRKNQCAGRRRKDDAEEADLHPRPEVAGHDRHRRRPEPRGAREADDPAEPPLRERHRDEGGDQRQLGAVHHAQGERRDRDHRVENGLERVREGGRTAAHGSVPERARAALRDPRPEVVGGHDRGQLHAERHDVRVGVEVRAREYDGEHREGQRLGGVGRKTPRPRGRLKHSRAHS